MHDHYHDLMQYIRICQYLSLDTNKSQDYCFYELAALDLSILMNEEVDRYCDVGKSDLEEKRNDHTHACTHPHPLTQF